MPHNNVEGFRLSPQQGNLWSLQQASTSQIYQAISTFLITGALRKEILERALHDVVTRHEILRTTFQRPPGIKIPFQVVSERAEISWRFDDLNDLDQEVCLRKLEGSFAVERNRPFDFTQGPLLRASLFQLSPERHILLLSLPALCADWVTVANLMGEIANAYDLILQGGEFVHEPMQYADFAEWQNEFLESSDEQAEKGRDYWQRLMDASISPLTLPFEKQTTNSQTFQPDAVSVNLELISVAKLESLAREYKTSIDVVLFACWVALVWRLTDRSDLVIFNLFDGRRLEDLRNAMGLYAKYLPVACHCEDVSFATHLRGICAALGSSEAWQDYFDPNKFFEAARDSVAFEFAEQAPARETSGLNFSVAKQEVCFSPFRLKFSCLRSVDSIRAQMLYDPLYFDRETIERYAGYFTRLLARVSVGDPSERSQAAKEPLPIEVHSSSTLGTIDILGEDERRRLLSDFNQTTSEFSVNKCIHELFEAQAARTPEAIALVCGDRELTYSELNVRANQLAHLLRGRGLTPNKRAGLCTERSVETIISLLGILKAGGAYVPLNPDHPTARLTLQLAESNASFLITKGVNLDDSLTFNGEVIDLDRDSGLLLAEPATNPELIGASENLAYVIYTSGSSGVPKGVAVSHQALVNYTEFILQRLQVTERMHFASVSTITADLGNTSIFPALVSGGCLHLISYDVAMEGSLFSKYVAKRPVDVLKIVPSHFSTLLAACPDGDILPRKYLILGGEVLSWDLIARVSQTKHTCELINHYGPTETTVGSLTFSVNLTKVSTQSLTAPIGRPIANTQAYILDRHLNPTPIGVAGELHISGAGLAAGYLNQPKETAARFVPSPFSDEPDGRVYRTGDLARYLPDGNIEFLGRVDHQVKVRGFRVEPGEIEAVLSRHLKVSQAVVMPEAATSDNQRLIAYVVAADIKPPTNEELRSFLGQHLPDYMIPSTFMFLKALPLTSNGKIDRAALPAPDEHRPDLQRLFVAPRTPVEKELADIWAEFLKLNEVGVHDNFFELGGHSLLATQVVHRMRKALNCEIPLRSLFESPTVAQIADQIGALTAGNAQSLLAEIEKLSDEEVERLLKAEQL